MTQTTTALPDPETAAAESRAAQVTFLDLHRPGLPPDTYTVRMSQDVTVRGTGLQTFATARRFTVAGERLVLAPADVVAAFPPDASLGDHADVLPHVVLDRATAPWDYSADRTTPGDGPPWLALLLLTGQEDLAGTITATDFTRQYRAPAGGPDAATVWAHLLDPGTGWLRPLPADPGAALVVARVQRAAATLDGAFTDVTGAVEALLDRSRSPQVVTVGDLKAASTGPVHWPGLQVDPAQHADTDPVTVIDVERGLLTAVLPTEAGLRLLTHVRRPEDATGAPLGTEHAVVLGARLPQRNGSSTVHLVSVEGRYRDGTFDDGGAPDGDYLRLVSLTSWRFACVDPQGDFTGLLRGLDRAPAALRLPARPDGAGETYLSAGFVPLPHRTRVSGTTVSWYRGPLLPCPEPGDVALPVATADALTRYDPALGLFDVSYSAAWELGRLLALQSPQVSTALYAWKRAHAQAVGSAGAWLLHPQWMPDAAQDAAALPPDVVSWFAQLRLLRPVPYRYLVPDDTMLPPESIRFVELDHAWSDCLVDGAFGIGRLTGTLSTVDQLQKALLVDAVPTHPAVTGFLLRSSVVPGWPGLLVDAYAAGNGPGPGARLEPLRVDRLGSGVLLCLFAGQVATVQVHLRPETLHFGTAGLPGGWSGPDGTVDPVRLAGVLGLTSPFSAADLVAGVPRVTFRAAGGPG